MNKIVELVSLASIVPPPNHEVSGGFTAMVDGKQVRVRAVLERTVVIEHHEGGERSVVRKDNCMVKPSAIYLWATRVRKGWKSFASATSSKTFRASSNRPPFKRLISSSAISRTRSASTVAPSVSRAECLTHCQT